MRIIFHALALDAASPTRFGLRCANESSIFFIVTLSISHSFYVVSQFNRWP